MDIFNKISRYARLLPVIEDNRSVGLYWTLYYFAIAVISIIILLFAYMFYSITINKFYLLWPIKLLNEGLILIYWILFSPFTEVFMGIFNCKEGRHEVSESMRCYEGIHIFFVILSIIFVLLLFSIVLLTALFYNETKPTEIDTSARSYDYSNLCLVIFRLGVIIYSTFAHGVLFIF